MRVALNLLYLIPGQVGGTETYARGLVRGLARVDQGNEYVLLLNRESKGLEFSEARNFNRVVLGVNATSRPRRYAWEQLYLPWVLLRRKVDIVHSLGYVGPLLTSCPTVLTIPDLNYRVLKDTIPGGKRRIVDFFSSRAARNAAHVITISQFSKAQIEEQLRIPPSKITVTHLGPGWDRPAAAEWEEVKTRYRLPERYISAFGGGSLHKNIPRLIEAFEGIAQWHPHSLVILGHLPAEAKAAADRSPVAARIQCLGYVATGEIEPILRHSEVFALPSRYEGFGMPLLEAQMAGVPVACSTAGSLPEVGGGSVLMFNPLSVTEMTEALDRLLGDPALCERLRQAAKANLQRFSWDNTARETLRVYEQVYSVAGAGRNGRR